MHASDTPKHPLKVLVLVHENLYGGGSRQSFYILSALTRKGLIPVLVSNAQKSWLGRQIEATSLPVTTYYTDWIQRAINPFKDFGVLLYLIRVFWQEKPDVVLTSGIKLIGLGSIAAWICRVPRSFAIIRGQGAQMGSFLLRLVYAMEWFVARLGVRFIAVCEYNRQEMIEQQICHADALFTVHNGTDIEKVQSGQKGIIREKFGIPKDAYVIGMIGRFSNQKCFDQFIRFVEVLCQRHPNVYGLLIGDGENHQALGQQIDQTGFSDRILITGFLQDMENVYADLDLSVLFTRYEGCANALIESSAAGIPMIVEDVCGNAEVVLHGQNGYVVSAGDIEQAVHYAEQLIREPEQAKAMRQAGQSIAKERFDRNQQQEKLIGILSQ